MKLTNLINIPEKCSPETLFNKFENIFYVYFKIFLQGYAITVVLGNDRCSDTKLYHIMKVKGKNNWTWRFLQYRLTENNLIRGESMDIDFLTRINNVNDKSCITYMTSWSNQLYISDAGKFH